MLLLAKCGAEKDFIVGWNTGAKRPVTHGYEAVVFGMFPTQQASDKTIYMPHSFQLSLTENLTCYFTGIRVTFT